MANFALFPSSILATPSYQQVGQFVLYAAAPQHYATYRQQSIEITIEESILAVDFVVRLYSVLTGHLIKELILQAGVHTVAVPASVSLFATCFPYQGDVWRAGRYYKADALVFPANTLTTPYYYQRLVAGLSGANEPSWPTGSGALCNDGDINNAWLLIDRLAMPFTHGPRVA